MTDRPVTIPRRSFTKREQLAQFIAQDGRCNCGRCDGLKLQPGRIHEQHSPPYDLRKHDPDYDGKPSYLWTADCHKAITKEKDGPVIKKARHQGGGRGSQIAKRKNKSYRPIPGEKLGVKYARQKAFKAKIEAERRE